MSTFLNTKSIIKIERFYQNSDGMRCAYPPPNPTCHGSIIPCEFAKYHIDYPCETALERAIRLDIVDIWTLHVIVTSNSRITTTYKNKHAERIWNTLVKKLKL